MTAFEVDIIPDESGSMVIPDRFLAASEYGCIVRRPQANGTRLESMWRFSVPNGSIRVSYS